MNDTNKMLHRRYSDVDRADLASLEGHRLARLNKLYIIRAAVQDMIDNDLRVSTFKVFLSQDLAEIMCSVAASDLDTVLSVHTLDGQKIGDIRLNDEDDHKVFVSWEPSLSEELDRALDLIDEVNVTGGYLGDNPLQSTRPLY
jgi:hypothetical protein